MKLSRKIKTLAKKLAAFSGGRADAPACAAGEVNTDDEDLNAHECSVRMKGSVAQVPTIANGAFWAGACLRWLA
ncbi:MAG: hypothetical protein EB128_11935 [Betaproteobacteria bacterium]|nr:hypothetical protein [Betaproteobacteria bacterium]